MAQALNAPNPAVANPLPPQAGAPALELVPGELAPVECPAGAQTPLKAGDTLPRAAAGPDAAAFVVARVEGNKIWLGPLKPGLHAVEVPCSADGTSTVSLNVRLVEMKAEDLPPPQPPLPPEAIPYPAWVWGLALGLLAALISAVAAVWWRQRRRRALAGSRRPAAPVRNPAEKFAHFLDSAGKERFAEREEPEAIKRFYSEANERLRDYLEFKLGFRAQEATTREFAGELKVALARHNSAPAEPGSSAPRRIAGEAAGLIESLMAQADQVRFAAERPPLETRQGFLKGLRQARSLVGDA